MAAVTEFSNRKKAPFNGYSITEQFDGVMVTNALSNAKRLSVSQGV